jgi:anti-anti-sigma regulatory factor
MADLHATVRAEPGLVVVELTGAAGVPTVAAMRAAFGQARAVPGLPAVVVLVGSVTFLDPLGVGVLAFEQMMSHVEGREFFVCGENSSLVKVAATVPKPVTFVQVTDLDEARLLAGVVAS